MVYPCQTQPYIEYLVDKKLPEVEVLRQQIVHRAKAYTVISGQLYKQSTTRVFQRCVCPQEGIEILPEIQTI
jgi:hypothetical protein